MAVKIQQYAYDVEVLPNYFSITVVDITDYLNIFADACDIKIKKGIKTAGLDVFKGKVIDMWKEFVVEPLRIKTQVINAATESAIMILRIDDVIATSKSSAPAQAPNMNGMPGFLRKPVKP